MIKISNRTNYQVSKASYPIASPRGQQRGIYLNAWITFVESESSPMALLMTPVFPFINPERDRLTMSPVNVLEKPKLIMETTTPQSPNMMTGFRPTMSESRDHCKTQRHSTKKKHDSYRLEIGTLVSACGTVDVEYVLSTVQLSPHNSLLSLDPLG